MLKLILMENNPLLLAEQSYINNIFSEFLRICPDIVFRRISDDQTLAMHISGNGITALNTMFISCGAHLEEASVLGITSLLFLPSATQNTYAFQNSAELIIEGFEEITADYLHSIYLRSHSLPVTIGNTGRLTIREIGLADIPSYHAICSECSFGITQKLLLSDETQFREYHKSYMNYRYRLCGFGYWGLFLKNTGSMIGFAGLESDSNEDACLGYAISSSYRNKGYATEACRFIIRYAHEQLDFTNIIVRINSSNHPSLAVADKLTEEFSGLIQKIII